MMIVRRLLSLLFLMTFTLEARAVETPTQFKVELENQIRDRVIRIIEKTEKDALVQVNVQLKMMQSDLPGVGFNAEVVPVDPDGRLGSRSIERVEIRILTPKAAPAEWVQKELARDLKSSGVNVKIAYEVIAGEFKKSQDDQVIKLLESMKTDFFDQFVEAFKGMSSSSTQGIDSVKFALYGIIGGLVLCILLATLVMFRVVRRFESSMIRAVDEKLAPALAQSGRNEGGASVKREQKDETKSKPIEIQFPSSSSRKELADIPVKTILNLLSDCYWTNSDGYAHWLWTQMTQAQRETALASGKIDRQYFSYVSQFEAVNLKYHNDARYLTLAADFHKIDQAELADWVRSHPEEFFRVTPLRSDLLPIGLPERIKFSQLTASGARNGVQPVELTKASKARLLPIKLQVKTLLASDEEFIFENADVLPAEIRKSLNTLVWLALAPLPYRQQILAEVDARQLAEAWSGPAQVLSKLSEALPAKKLEMIEHFLKEAQADRDCETFAYLVQAGLNAPLDVEPKLGLAA